jgi:hypothetical protein
MMKRMSSNLMCLMAVDWEVFGQTVGQEAANLANSLLIHPIQHDLQSHNDPQMSLDCHLVVSLTAVLIFPGSCCMLSVHGCWISQKAETALATLPALSDLKGYIASRLKLEPTIVDEIDQDVIAAVRATHSWAGTARISKLLSFWLPVGHNWRHYGADNDLYPCCGVPDETFSHLLQCQAPAMLELRQQIITKVIHVGTEVLLPTPIVRLVELMLRSCFGELSQDPPFPVFFKRYGQIKNASG